MTYLKQRYDLTFFARFEATPTRFSEQEAEWVREYRWWCLHFQHSEWPHVEPERIALGNQGLVKHGLPPNPLGMDTL